MNIDPLNFTLTHLKKIAIQTFDNVNGTTSVVPPANLDFVKSTDDDKVLLIDSLSKSGVLMNKFVLADLFPSVINIQAYKKSLVISQDKLTEETNDRLDNKYSTKLTIVDPDVINTASFFNENMVSDFFVFCRVFGFYELTLKDVDLISTDNKLIISVNPTHDLFTGFIEVLV